MIFKIDNIGIKLKVFENKIGKINELLAFCTENNCSDLFVKCGERPYINRYGKLFEVPCLPINKLVWNEFANDGISSEANAIYVREKMLDFAYEIDIPENSIYYKTYSKFRYRVSAGFSRTKNIATFRMITPDLPSFDSINFPNDSKYILEKAFQNKNGINIFIGPTGSGKTTSMSACINDFTKKNGPLDNNMIITLEDPIEYIYSNTNSARIIQKELGKDFKNFPSGVKQALREHPNTILCGELRDKEGINTCIEAARTGHRVITTFHAGNVADSVARMYNHVFNNGNNDIMYDLIANINLMLCQRLSSSNNSFILETQYLLLTEDIKHILINSIDENKNIMVVINDLFKNKELFNNHILKDWS